MDIAALALIITAVSGAILGTATLLNNRRTSKITTRVEDTGVAFEALNTTVKTLSDEHNRITNELEQVRGEYEKCEEARKEFAKIVGEQGVQISKQNRAIEDLTSLVQKISPQSS